MALVTAQTPMEWGTLGKCRSVEAKLLYRAARGFESHRRCAVGGIDHPANPGSRGGIGRLGASASVTGPRGALGQGASSHNDKIELGGPNV